MPELTPVSHTHACDMYTYWTGIMRMSFLDAGEHQMELLDCVAAKFYEEPGVFKLLVSDPVSVSLCAVCSMCLHQEVNHAYCQTHQIVDSIMALFRVDFSGRGELADRQQKLAQMLSRLQKISEGEEARGMLCACSQ